MQPLDLDVQYAVGIDGRPPFLQPLGQHGLVFRFDIQQLFQECAVILMVQQSFQLPGIPFPIRANGLRDQVGQSGVAAHQPPAEGNAVGLVVELLWIQHIKGVQLGVLQDLRVQLRHTVDLCAAVDVHMGHMDHIMFIPDSRVRVVTALPRPLIQRANKRKQLGRHPFQVGGGPLFQCFCQNGMVGVGTGTLHQVHGLLQLHAPSSQQPEQLGDHHGRMGVVDVDHGIFVQFQ